MAHTRGLSEEDEEEAQNGQKQDCHRIENVAPGERNYRLEVRLVLVGLGGFVSCGGGQGPSFVRARFHQSCVEIVVWIRVKMCQVCKSSGLITVVHLFVPSPKKV